MTNQRKGSIKRDTTETKIDLEFIVDGEVNGGKIKYLNLAVKETNRKTATNKLLSKGLDFTVNVLGTSPRSDALGMKASIISLLKKSGRTVINYSA